MTRASCKLKCFKFSLAGCSDTYQDLLCVVHGQHGQGQKSYQKQRIMPSFINRLLPLLRGSQMNLIRTVVRKTLVVYTRWSFSEVRIYLTWVIVVRYVSYSLNMML